MAVLLLELQGNQRAAVLPARLLIGRRSMNHLVIESPAVSRIHAWIDREGENFYISDTGSRSGTFVNSRPIGTRQLLSNADKIGVGPAKLTFFAANVLPPGAVPVKLPAKPVIAPSDTGILFDCPTCRAPLWATLDMAGGTGQCKYCTGDLAVPGERATTHRSTRSTSAAPAPSSICGICHSSIGALEGKTVCPACGLLFHADCWHENHGCSSYGCSQSNVLKPADAPSPDEARGAPAVAAISAESDLDDQPPRFPWEFLLLAGSVVSALLGAMAFGLPSLALAGGSVTYIARSRGTQDWPQRRIVLLSTALSVVGIVAGAAVSYVLYFHVPRT